MALDAKMRKRVERTLAVVDDHGTKGPRLVDDARRLWDRINHFVRLSIAPLEFDADALELACYAMQLPMRQSKPSFTGKLGRTNLRERSEQAAEMLVSLDHEGDADEGLLDRATRLLQEMPHRSPMIDEAKLLADAVNLDDFGVVGLAMQMVQLTLQGDGVTQLADGSEKREQYGYWDARLKDGFHFEPVRQLARRRLENARSVATLLLAELGEDKP